MKKTLTIESDAKKYQFEFILHKSENPGDQMIEPEFYEKWSPEHKSPANTHFEMEMISPNLELHQYAKVFTFTLR